MSLAGQHAMVLDYESKELLVSGTIMGVKEGNFNLISFDNIIFFHALGTERYRVVLGAESLVGTHLLEKIPEYYRSLPFNRNNEPADVYIENAEYDLEVRDLIHALNKLPDITTTGSCSGHGTLPVFITMFFDSLKALTQLVHFIQVWDVRLRIVSDPKVYQGTISSIHLKLESLDIGEPAYVEVTKMAKFIQSYLDASSKTRRWS